MSLNDSNDTLLRTEWLDGVGTVVLRCFQGHEREVTQSSVPGRLPQHPTRMLNRLRAGGGTRKGSSGDRGVEGESWVGGA